MALKELEEYLTKLSYSTNGVIYGLRGVPVGSYTKRYGRLTTPVGVKSISRCLWFMHYGEWPKGEIDHIDGNTHNNSLNNLRDVSREENAKNRRSYSSNTSGYKGVYPQKYKGKVTYLAKLQHNGKPLYLGSFSCRHKAALAYNNKVIELGNKFYSLNIIEENDICQD